jgi:hypothetical protein
MTRWRMSAFLLAMLAGGTVLPAHAIPAFARQYGTSCSTCHLDFPKLNDFGKAFKDAGFKFPKDDESFIKIPPVIWARRRIRRRFPIRSGRGRFLGFHRSGCDTTSSFRS